MIHTVYCEKRNGFDVRAQKLRAELKAVLGVDTPVRIFIRYDMEGKREDFERALSIVFSEPPADKTYLRLPKTKGRTLCIRYLPGQYDQRADSAAQCIQMLTLGEKPLINCATVYAFEAVADAEFEKIKAYLINPVETCESPAKKPRTLAQSYDEPPPEERAEGFTQMGEKQLDRFHNEKGFAFSRADLAFIQEFFKKEGRDPFYAELKVLDTYWSDHCRHTTFNTELTDISIESDIPEIAEAYKAYKGLFEKHYAAPGGAVKRDKYPSLMNMAVIGAKELTAQGKAPHLDISPEINACSIKVAAEIGSKSEDWIVMFKNETHNHPTEIEPFGGAATCLGGAIRDPLSGRSYVYQSMRLSGAADINAPLERTIKGKLPQRVISTAAAGGFSAYGNQIGLATGQVTEVFHPGYAAKRLEAGFVVGAAPAANIVRKEPVPGDIVLLIGGRTGRDGCGGATGSSKAHTADSLNLCGAEVQKGNPITERKLQRLFRDPGFTTLVKRCNDFGAGGVSVAVGELSDGMDINLDAVPKKYQGLTGTELAISESQERMAVVTDADSLDKVLEKCAAENLEAAVIAQITDKRRMRMYFKGQLIVDLPRAFLDTNGVRPRASAVIRDKKFKVIEYFNTPGFSLGGSVPRNPESDKFELSTSESRAKDKDIVDALPLSGNYVQLTKRLLAAPNTASQKGLTELFDSTIGAGTVLMPLGGTRQLSPSAAMAAKIPAGEETNTATVAAFGFDPYLSVQSPFLGAVYAVALSVIKAVISGADYDTVYLSFQEYFEKLRSEPQRWGKPAAALLGALYAQLGFGRPAIGGKDSMSGSFEGLDVPPALISFALGIGRADRIIGSAVKNPGCAVYRYRLPKSAGGVPDLQRLQSFLRGLQALVAAKKIEFASAAGEGGAICALVKALFGEGFGFKAQGVTGNWFTPAPGDIIFGISAEKQNNLNAETQGNAAARTGQCNRDIKEFLREHGCALMGTAQSEPVFDFGGEACPMQEFEAAFTRTFEKIYPASAQSRGRAVKSDYRAGQLITRKARVAHPRVFIPVFPGTNCEYDSARAFERAGAKTDVLVVKNLTAADMAQSVKEIKRRIEDCNILMLPGGFSGGDEPDGSGKFIAATFISPYIAEAINDLLNRRDGLILGICNGFQALIKLGLLPFGRISPLTKDSPTLTFNGIARHVSQIVSVRIASNLSPWLAAVKPGEVYSQPVSHGEGRFTASAAHLKQLVKNGQIATQYADAFGKPAMESPFNPNGSLNAAEGITSPDGRVLGKMGHSERIGRNLLKNVPGLWDLRLFESGVKYFD